MSKAIDAAFDTATPQQETTDALFGQPKPTVIVSDFDADMARLHQIEADIKAALDEAINAFSNDKEAARFLEQWDINHRYGLPVAPSKAATADAWEDA